MTKKIKKTICQSIALLAIGAALTGCISPVPMSSGRYTAPIGGSPVISNETPYSAALRQLSRYTAGHAIRVAVGQIADYTGKLESDNSGRKLTQGAALMAMSALAKAGVPLVERFDTSVAEMELKYANNKLIGEEKPDKSQPTPFRRIMAGSIPGSNYYLVGGITELNFNIRSEGANGDGGGTATNSLKGLVGSSIYVMNVGIDLRLVDTTTLEVVDVISYQKQIIGRQISAGVFDFMGNTFFDAALGDSALEPIQLAVRSVIERATLEMMERLYHTPHIALASDPLSGGVEHHTTMARATQNTVAQNSVAMNQPAPRQPQQPAKSEKQRQADRLQPYHGYGESDPVADMELRGSVD